MLPSLACLLISPIVYGCMPTEAPDDLPKVTTTSAITTNTVTTPTTPTTTTPTTTTLRICPPNWILFNNFCYFHGTTKKTWLKAEEDCVAMGSHLATIHSTAENDFIVMLTTQMATLVYPNGFVAIGVRRNDLPLPPPYNFYTVDGTPLDYTNWGSGQPDNAHSTVINEACVQLFSDNLTSGQIQGTWNDVVCTFLMQYVCKM